MIFLRYALVTQPRLNTLLFVILLFISASLFPGGTINDPEPIGYSFSRNFFSDLGIYSSKILKSFILFGLSLLTVGVTFIIYFMSFFTSKNRNIPAIIACLFGIFGSLCFSAIGLLPHNYYLDLHLFAVTWAFRSFLITSTIFSIALFKDQRFDYKYFFGYVMFAILIFLYVLVLEFGPNPKADDFALVFSVISQKIIVLVFIFSFLLQSVGNSKLISNTAI